jgi:hypothetical protein
MNYNRRSFILNSSITLAGSLFLPSCSSRLRISEDIAGVPETLRLEMYNKGLDIAKSKIRGGEQEPFFKKPFVDAAFSSNIFYWDTCFIATYAKYHQDVLPILNALDNFYNLMEPDGFICREYTKEGKPMWPKDHPVSVNPPLLAMAELELYSIHKQKERLASVFPHLKQHFLHWLNTWRGNDHLFFNDALGSGMDNIDRFPEGWKDDGQGIRINNLHPEIFNYSGLYPAWNRQGRMVDTSAQVALFSRNMIEIVSITGNGEDIKIYKDCFEETKYAINKYCWNEYDACYYDLGYSKQIPRKHIGMFWVLWAEVIPKNRLKRFLSHLINPAEFWRKIPVATLSADDKDFSPAGDYWRGSVWAPTNYMILRGLKNYYQHSLAKALARKYYAAVAEVYKNTHTFWENYAPDSFEKGNNSRPDFCGWTGIVPITIYREFL